MIIFPSSDHDHQLADTSTVNRSHSAPSQLHRSMSVREGAQDLRRLQRWRTAIQKKKQLQDVGSKSDTNDDNLEFVSIMDDIFAFIGSDPGKEVSETLEELTTPGKILLNLLFHVKTLVDVLRDNMMTAMLDDRNNTIILQEKKLNFPTESHSVYSSI